MIRQTGAVLYKELLTEFRQPSRISGIFFFALALYALLTSAAGAEAQSLQASFTQAQADAGATAYRTHCAECHLTSLQGSFEAPQLAGGNFRLSWGDVPVADLLEFKDANPFRVRAYRKGARTIRDLSEPITAIIADPERDLTDIEGIGKDLAEKCATLVETGDLPMLGELLEQVPQSVLAIMRVPGLGPKKAAALYKELGVTSLDELRGWIDANRATPDLSCEQRERYLIEPLCDNAMPAPAQASD